MLGLDWSEEYRIYSSVFGYHLFGRDDPIIALHDWALTGVAAKRHFRISP